MQTITTHISSETALLLRQLATQKSVSEENLVAEAIEDYLDEYGNYTEALRRAQDANDQNVTLDKAKKNLGF